MTSKVGFLGQLSAIYIAKNTDYGNSASITFNDYGVISYVTRMRDKVERYRRISRNKAMVDEDIKEVLMDLTNYAIMCSADLMDLPYHTVSTEIMNNHITPTLKIPKGTDFICDGLVDYLGQVAYGGTSRRETRAKVQALATIIDITLQMLVNLEDENNG